MKAPLLTNTMLLIVFVLATLVVARRAGWRRVHVWLVSVGTLMMCVFVLARCDTFAPWEAGLLAVSFLLKNVALLALLAEPVMRQREERLAEIVRGNTASIAIDAVLRGGPVAADSALAEASVRELGER